MREHELSEFEIEQDGLRLRIRKDAVGTAASGAARRAAVRRSQPRRPIARRRQARRAPVAPAARRRRHRGPEAAEEIELAVVKSPIVGTFYRSPEPAAPPFVEIGTTVKKGQVLCIIEAMKLMNEIDSEYDGEIVNIYVENGQPVQYGERLFAIRTT